MFHFPIPKHRGHSDLIINYRPSLPPLPLPQQTTDKPFFRDTTATVFALINGTATINCNISAEPPANFSWYRDGRRLSTPDGRYSIGEMGKSAITVRSPLIKVGASDSSTCPLSLQVLISNASFFGDYKCKAVNSIGDIERVFTLRPGLKPVTPSLTLFANNNNKGNTSWPANDVAVAVDSASNAIYLHLSLPSEQRPVNVTEMDATGFRVQFISHDNYRQSNGTWTHAESTEFLYRADGGPYVLQNLTRNRIYLLRASTKNVAGFSDYSEPPLEVNLSASPLGLTSGGQVGRYFPLIPVLLHFIIQICFSLAMPSKEVFGKRVDFYSGSLAGN